MKNYCFRAVYFKNRQDGEVDYRSALINEAEEPYDTIGVYDLTDGSDNIEQKHVADMPREDFQRALDSRFPNGFECWQKSHYEIVSALNKQGSNRSNSFYFLALELTNNFEKIKKKKRSYETDFSEEIKGFVESELNSNKYKLALLKDITSKIC